jgi:hypothetical protein
MRQFIHLFTFPALLFYLYSVAGSAFVPEYLWPEKYKFLFIDFIFLKIYNLIEDPDNECRSCSPPTSGYKNETFYESNQEDDEHVNEARYVLQYALCRPAYQDFLL